MDAGIQFPSIKDVCGCSPICAPIFCKNGSSRKANIVGCLEVSLNTAVHLSKLTAVTFINDKHTPFIPQGSHLFFIFGVAKCCGHLLNGGHNKSLAGITQSPNQRSCAVGIVHAPILKGVVFVYGLVIEVLAVNKKEHLVDTAVIPQQSC